MYVLTFEDQTKLYVNICM